jgi:hypothetical protein
LNFWRRVLRWYPELKAFSSDVRNISAEQSVNELTGKVIAEYLIEQLFQNKRLNMMN